MAFYAKIFSNLCSRATLFEIKSASMSWISCPRTFADLKAGLFSNQILTPVNPELHSTRTNVRKHFPRPSERKRIARHGYETRLKTPGGRAVLMRRILKGRFVLSH